MDGLRLRTPVEFGHAVKRCRRELGLTQVELAAKVGVGRRWIVELEQGKRSAELGLVLRTVAALRMELELVRIEDGPSVLDDLLEGEGRP